MSNLSNNQAVKSAVERANAVLGTNPERIQLWIWSIISTKLSQDLQTRALNEFITAFSYTDDLLAAYNSTWIPNDTFQIQPWKTIHANDTDPAYSNVKSIIFARAVNTQSKSMDKEWRSKSNHDIWNKFATTPVELKEAMFEVIKDKPALYIHHKQSDKYNLNLNQFIEIYTNNENWFLNEHTQFIADELSVMVDDVFWMDWNASDKKALLWINWNNFYTRRDILYFFVKNNKIASAMKLTTIMVDILSFDTQFGDLRSIFQSKYIPEELYSFYFEQLIQKSKKDKLYVWEKKFAQIVDGLNYETWTEYCIRILNEIELPASFLENDSEEMKKIFKVYSPLRQSLLSKIIHLSKKDYLMNAIRFYYLLKDNWCDGRYSNTIKMIILKHIRNRDILLQFQNEWGKMKDSEAELKQSIRGDFIEKAIQQ